MSKLARAMPYSKRCSCLVEGPIVTAAGHCILLAGEGRPSVLELPSRLRLDSAAFTSKELSDYFKMTISGLDLNHDYD